jgi:hypothetical protein
LFVEVEDVNIGEVAATVSNWDVGYETIVNVDGEFAGVVLVKDNPFLGATLWWTLDESEVAPKIVVLPHVTIMPC